MGRRRRWPPSTAAPTVAKATRPTRGVFNAVTDAQFTITAALGVNETVPLYESVVHCCPRGSRSHGGGRDEGVECLEKYNAANDSTSKRIRRGVDAEGRTFCSRPSGIGSAYAITWSSAAFRRLLGSTGSEAEVTSGGVITLTSTHPRQACSSCATAWLRAYRAG